MRMKFFADFYNNDKRSEQYDTTIKWSRNLKVRYSSGKREKFDVHRIGPITYRPFSPSYFYKSDIFIDENGLMNAIFEIGSNKSIGISGNNSSKPFQTLVVDTYPSLDLLEKTQFLPLYYYPYSNGRNRIDNITDWALNGFRNQYNDVKIQKEDIFSFVYAVLHDPAYRTKYELNLKRDFPRIPFYSNFWKWKSWGTALLEMHIGYEKIEPYSLKEITDNDHQQPKVKLKADKTKGRIILDEATTLDGIPPEAWEYKLGIRSALEWILDQYKEKKPKDPTIAEKFNTYRFADYKAQVIDLLKRVCAVSVETVKIMREMEAVSESK